MNKDRILQTLKKDVRSLLIASKLGLSVQELEHDYRTMIGSPLPVKALDYRSTMELLLDMPDVVKIFTKGDGSVVLSAVVNEETKSMAELVSNQKTSCKRKGVYKRRVTRPVSHMDLVRRGKIAPVLPASVKIELRDLLSISPLLVSQLESAYYRRFGRSFQYTRYGFYSLIEVLRSVSDFVQVQQTRAGSLLILKPPVTTRAVPFSGSNLQYPIPRNVFRGSSNVAVKGVQNVPKMSPVPESSPPPAAPQPAGVTPLDKLFMAAEAEYYTNIRLAKSAGAEKTQPESENPDSEDILPSSLVPSATAQDIASKPVSSSIPDIKADVTERTSSDTSPVKTDVAELSTDRSLQWLEKKFQEDFKLCLSQTRAGFVIGDDLRQDIKHVVGKHPEGLRGSHLPAAYKQYTGKELPFQEMGFMSVLDLVGALGDMLYVEDAKDGQEWHVFDIQTKNKQNADGERTDAELTTTNGLITRWNVSTEKPDRLKPPVIISQADEKSLWCPPDVPVYQRQIPPDAVRKQQLCALSRMKRGFMLGVYVENATSPSNFYIRCYNKETSQKLEDMMIEMRFCYSNELVSSRYIVPDEYVEAGEIYALCVEGDVWWYRVIVHDLLSSQEVQVYYPDFGSLVTVKRCWLRFLKACYMTLPAQAVPAALACLKPIEDQWSAEAIKVFHSQCARGPLVAVVMQYMLDQLCLFLCDTSSDEDIYLHQVLISTRNASFAQEPGFCHNIQTRNPFMQYLIQSAEQPQDIFQDASEQSTGFPARSPDVPLPEPVLQSRVSEDGEPELPYLEAFPTGEDLWDETWSCSGSTTSLNEALKPTLQNLGKDQEENPKPEQIDDFTKRCDREHSQPLEEFYISLIESRTVSEKSVVPQSPPRKCDEPEKTAQFAADLHDPSSSLTPKGENLQSLDDNCLFHESSSLSRTAQVCNPLNPLTGFQKFQVPRRSATMALGPAARLAAAPGSLLHWVTDPGKV